MTAWRIAVRQHAALDGEGARLYGSRWTPRGWPAAFAFATLSLAALERLVHTDSDLEAADLVAVEIRIPPQIAIESLGLTELPANWRTCPPPVTLAAFGERWLKAGRSAVLSVPSVVIPRERNLIINPVHAAFGRLSLVSVDPFSFDPRLWRSPDGRPPAPPPSPDKP